MLLAKGFAAMDLKPKAHNYWGWGRGYKQPNSVPAHSTEIVYLEGKIILLYFPSAPR